MPIFIPPIPQKAELHSILDCCQTSIQRRYYAFYPFLSRPVAICNGSSPEGIFKYRFEDDCEEKIEKNKIRRGEEKIKKIEN
jgi:hypothetical protein